MAHRNYIAELMKDERYRELAIYMNHRLVVTNRTIFEYNPFLDGIRQDYLHLLPLLEELIEKGFFDGD